MRKKLLLLLLTSAACLLSARSASACTCAMPGSPCAAYGAASAVFVGTVTGVRTSAKADGKGWLRARGPRVYTFAVEQAFSGVAGAEVEVATGMGGGDCGYVFERGVRYVVYASAREEGGRLSTSICTRTRPASEAAEDLEFLRGLAAGDAGGTLSGAVARVLRRVRAGDWQPGGPVPDASLTVAGPGFSRELRADAQGRFSLAGLRPGVYKVRLALPEGLTTHREEQEFRVADRGCAVVDFPVFDDGQIGGTLTDADGRPAANVLLTLYEADDPDPLALNVLLLHTDDEGRYTFEGLPPGRYRLAVNLTRFPDLADQTGAFPRTYYPGTTQASEAEAVALGEGERRRGLDWRLPARRAAVPVEVFVTRADGRPVEKALVTLRDVTYGGDHRVGGETDAEGRFMFRGFEGQTFVVEAWSQRPTAPGVGLAEHAEPLRVTLSNPPAPLRLVIREPR